MKHRVFFSTCLLLTIAAHTSAQTQFSGWLADFNTFKLNKKLSIHNDIQLRSSDQVDHVNTLLLRAGLNYHINKKFIATAGYAYVHDRRLVNNNGVTVSGYSAEHRIWEQLIFNHALVLGAGSKARKGTVQHRLRLEQRFLPTHTIIDNEVKRNGDVFANRLRYFIRNVNPLVPWSASGKAPFLALQNEVFVNLGDKSGVNGEFFDQNRAYVALGYRFHAKFDAELGYMNQYRNGRGKAFTNNHILQVATYVRL